MYRGFLLIPMICLCCEKNGDETITDLQSQDVNETQQETQNGNCECIAQLPQGTCFRFIEMKCEPGTYQDPNMAERAKAVCDFLNEIWKRDIEKQILNVLFKIESYDPNTKTLKLKAGAAWKYKKDGTPCTTATSKECDGSFKLLEKYAVEFVFDVEGCNFKTQQKYDLFYHSGDPAQPVLCGPELPQPNALPLKNLDAKGAFDNKCEQIPIASLDGCIAVSAAEKVCMCNDFSYKKCPINPKVDGQTYCEKTCGVDFGTNFGGFVKDVAQLAPICKVKDEDGYYLGGTFRAQVLPKEMCE